MKVRRFGFAGTSGSTGSRCGNAAILFSFFMPSLPLDALCNYWEAECLAHIGR